LVGQDEVKNVNRLPGHPVAGVAIFRMTWAGCHNSLAAGLEGANKEGSDFDNRRPTYTKIVVLIVQGGAGGLGLEAHLQELSYPQI
jgi:hypothetical protein